MLYLQEKKGGFLGQNLTKKLDFGGDLTLFPKYASLAGTPPSDDHKTPISKKKRQELCMTGQLCVPESYLDFWTKNTSTGGDFVEFCTFSLLGDTPPSIDGKTAFLDQNGPEKDPFVQEKKWGFSLKKIAKNGSILAVPVMFRPKTSISGTPPSLEETPAKYGPAGFNNASLRENPEKNVTKTRSEFYDGFLTNPWIMSPFMEKMTYFPICWILGKKRRN